MLEIVRSRYRSLQAEAAGLEVGTAPDQLTLSRSYTGLDGIYIGLGSSWV